MASAALLALFAVAAGGLASAEPPLRGAEGNASALDNVSALEASLASIPFWCNFLPEIFQGSECQERQHGESPPPSTGSPTSPGPCAGLSVAERAGTPACAYSEQEALEFAYLSSAAFCGSDQLVSWTCGSACQHLPDMQDVRVIDKADIGAHAYVGRLRGVQCVLSFRGTDSAAGWVQDLKSLVLTPLPDCGTAEESCRVGDGFLHNYLALVDGVQSGLAAIGCDASAPLLITGHSLGGALATLAVWDLHRLGFNVTKVYTFGQPRVGDAAFASALGAALASVPFYRVTRGDDPIVHLPPPDRFHHTATEVYYKGSVSDGFRLCDASGEDPACAGQRSTGDVAGLVVRCAVPVACGHLRYLQPLMDGLFDAQCQDR